MGAVVIYKESLAIFTMKHYTSMVLAIMNSLSLWLSHADIVSKWLNVESPK